MVDGKLQALYPGQGIPDFPLDVFLVIGELPAQVFSDHLRFLRIGDETDASKNYNAAYVQRSLAFLPVTRIIDAVADLVVLCDRVNLMAGLCTVKIQLSIRWVIPVVQRNAVWISVFPKHGKAPGN